MNGLPYYKAYPRDFLDGTAGMDFEVKGAYRLLLDLIYMHGGRLVDEPRFIAGHLGCSVKKWNSLRTAILATGKISVSGGYLGNLRADKELDSLKSFHDKQRENGSQPKRNKALAQATAQPKANHTEPEPEPDKDSEAKASAGDAGVDFAKAIFSNGVQFLCHHGVNEGRARAVIGTWRKDHPDPEIFDAIAACEKSGAIDPIPWITARLAPRFTPQFDPAKFEDRA